MCAIVATKIYFAEREGVTAFLSLLKEVFQASVENRLPTGTEKGRAVNFRAACLRDEEGVPFPLGVGRTVLSPRKVRFVGISVAVGYYQIKLSAVIPNGLRDVQGGEEQRFAICMADGYFAGTTAVINVAGALEGNLAFLVLANVTERKKLNGSSPRVAEVT